MQLKYNTTLLFLFIFFLFYSCKNKVNVPVQRQIERAIEIGDQKPQQALLILDSIQTPEDLDEKSFLLYQIAEVRAKRNLNEPITQEQTKLIVEATDFFERQGDLENASLANYYAARAYHSQSDVKQELRHYLDAYSFAKASKDSLMMGKTLYNIGIMYADQQVFDSTKIYLQKSIPLLDRYPEIQVQAYRLLAASFYLKDDFKNTLLYLDEGAPLLRQRDNSKYSYLYNTLYGAVYKRTGESQKAISYLQKNIADDKIPQKERIRTALNLMDIYTSNHNMDSATYCEQLVEPTLNTIVDDNELLLFAYDVFHNYYLEEGNNLKAKEYYALSRERQFIIDEQNESEKLFTVAKEEQIQQLRNSQKEYNKSLYVLIIFMTLIIAILAVVLVRLKLKRRKIIDQQKDHISLLQEEVDKLSQKRKSQDL